MATRTDVIQIQLEDNSILNVRATVLGGTEDVAAFDKMLSLSGVMATIESVADTLSKTIKKVKPQKAIVEFGIEFGIDAGALTALLVQGQGKGHLNIILEWAGDEK